MNTNNSLMYTATGGAASILNVYCRWISNQISIMCVCICVSLYFCLGFYLFIYFTLQIYIYIWIHINIYYIYNYIYVSYISVSTPQAPVPLPETGHWLHRFPRLRNGWAADLMTEFAKMYSPKKRTAGTWKSPVWSGKSSELNLHQFGFKMLVFGPAKW